jgi:hypothetical protein
MVLLNLESGVYFGLDAVGTRAWTLLAQQKSIADVCAIMLDEYEVGAGVLEDDITTLVGQLREKRLLIPVEAESE